MRNSYRKGIISLIIFIIIISSTYPIINGQNLIVNTCEKPYSKELIKSKEPFSFSMISKDVIIPKNYSWEGTIPFKQPLNKEKINYDLNGQGFIGITDTGWTPPDPIIAAGPEHLVVMTNGAIAFFQKNGTKEFQDEIEDSYGFWGEVGASNFVFDPEVIYDPHTNRFMSIACERGPGSKSYFLLAISDDSNPNGLWYKYRIDVTSLAGGDIDSPNIGVDSQAVYLTADFFTGGQKYLVFILEKNPLLNGSIGETQNMLIMGSQSFGIPVIYGDTIAMYMIEHFEGLTNNKVRLHAISDPLGSMQYSTYDLNVPLYSPPEDPPQKGTSTRVETFDNRFWSCIWRDGSFWATHHQGSNRVKARWYEINTNDWPNSGSPILIQSGDIDPGPDIRTFFTAITVDGFGNAGMCFARSSPNEYISIARCGRKVDDPLGEMQDVEIIKESSSSYSKTRWGDYSGISCDPSDNYTFWMHGEYTPGGNQWNTWISSCNYRKNISYSITNVSKNWNLITLPFNQSVNKSDIIVRFNQSNYSWFDAINNSLVSDFAFGWDRINQIYILKDIFEPGFGYWLYFYQTCELWANNITVINEDHITLLEKDWNIIGLPFHQNISKDEILVNGSSWVDAVVAGIISDFVFGWNRDNQYYYIANNILPGYAYWVYAFQQCVLKRLG